MGLSDRLMVLCGGEISGIVDPREVTKEEVGLMMIHVDKEWKKKYKKKKKEKEIVAKEADHEASGN